MISYPDTAEQIRTSRIFNSKWYYSIELAPGLITPGIYPSDLPMLPRIMLRRCDLRGAACLDMGTMEGLIPTLMARGGASEVVAIDAVDHCLEKLNAVKHYYGVDFAYQSVGLMYSLSNRFAGKSFDLINCSGLLYHVFSPLMVLAGLRSLLKRNGLLIVSTNVILDPGHFMEFNDRGRMQIEANTFWYLSVPLFDYMVRYLKLAPIDCAFVPHTAVRSDVDYVFDKPSGYLSIVCRATDDVLAMPDDTWMAQAARKSWEYIGLAGPDRMQSAPISQIAYKHDMNSAFVRPDGRSIDPWKAVGAMPPTMIAGEQDTHLLRLGDMT
jgi:SAM-dependent methyltransferase